MLAPMTRTKRQIAIAVEIDEPHPHHQDTFAGIQRYAREHPDWVCFIDEHPYSASDPTAADHAQYDGVIARCTPDLNRRLKHRGIPLVNIHYRTHRPGIASVLPDPISTGRAAAEHLIGLDMPRLAFVSDKIHKFSCDVQKAFSGLAEIAEVPCTAFYFKEPSYRNKKAWDEMKSNMFRCLKSITPPVGIYFSTAPLARVFIQSAEVKGWRIPRDMAVLCGRNLKSIVEVAPKISSLDVNYKQVGYMAAQLLDEMIEGKPIPHQPLFIPAGDIMARESTDCRLIEDDIIAQALQYISSNLQGPLRVEDIAHTLNVSRRLLHQRFSIKLGTSVSREIRRLRLEKAKRLLAEPERPIASISKAVGFASANVMNKNFIRELGTTPSAYRKQALGERPYKSSSAL